jgi:hypothetical protein
VHPGSEVEQRNVRVVETGSFSGAARQLRVGQPAVSKTIAQLEERLGVSLLLRSPRGLTPTEAGRNFYERAKRSIEEANASASIAVKRSMAISPRNVSYRSKRPPRSARNRRFKRWRHALAARTRQGPNRRHPSISLLGERYGRPA